MLSHLLRPAHVRAAAAAVVFARLQTLAVRAHLIRITSHGHPDFMVIQVRVRPVRLHLVGFGEPPTLNFQMLNPVDEQSPARSACDIKRDLELCGDPFLAGRQGLLWHRWPSSDCPTSMAVLGLERDISQRR
jgi:hypothetical protein